MLYVIWFFAMVVLSLAWIFRGWIFNAHYFFAVIIDALKDCFCQLIIDTQRLFRWRRKKKINLDVSEDFHHRDC